MEETSENQSYLLRLHLDHWMDVAIVYNQKVKLELNGLYTRASINSKFFFREIFSTFLKIHRLLKFVLFHEIKLAVRRS